eukprot:CAMPEP_0197624772 /NCGR_PEP_ID=MMETSP1338-20131121/4312_1 /TAXON_ID=43686 ORGANISM="Pelagodinium beii, Strain RCC1491" /NCGR_SAMPLE_ID=MMETSP1338 /ASSEMBLY_ACC=CAM_ASM_000754 /LENGTH=231 /DNA_ID=CAMNT_0043194989 /DNA_START=340 /DNA_END=1032 /DNA_ORIENTATION=+
MAEMVSAPLESMAPAPPSEASPSQEILSERKEILSQRKEILSQRKEPEAVPRERPGPFIRVDGYSSSPELQSPTEKIAENSTSSNSTAGAVFMNMFVIFLVIAALVAVLFAAKLWGQGQTDAPGTRRPFPADGPEDSWQDLFGEEDVKAAHVLEHFLLEDQDVEEGSSEDERAEAARQVKVILSAKSVTAVLGSGPVEERRIEFRRLAKLLHPDKSLVSGERANLALRRLL